MSQASHKRDKKTAGFLREAGFVLKKRMIWMKQSDSKPGLEMENQCYAQGYRFPAGVDEAGRGPLAGPVCAGAVILPPGLTIEGLNDSKKLSPKKRDILYETIKEKALAWSVAFVEPSVIDEINIRQATHQAMQDAVNQLKIPADYLLIDGNDHIPFSVPSEYIIKGDAKVQSIAAASIMAKVSRDRYMIKLDEIYPGYGFAKHKGYGTALHRQCIQKLGVCPIHRKTYMTDKVLGIK